MEYDVGKSLKWFVEAWQFASDSESSGGPIYSKEAPNIEWRVSQFCVGSACVRVARLPEGLVLVGDTKNISQDPICFSDDQWAYLVSLVKAGDFDFSDSSDHDVIVPQSLGLDPLDPLDAEIADRLSALAGQSVTIRSCATVLLTWPRTLQRWPYPLPRWLQLWTTSRRFVWQWRTRVSAALRQRQSVWAGSWLPRLRSIRVLGFVGATL